MPTLTLDALQLIDAIARRGSFAGAAEEMGRVPSAVTYAVRKLESDLDVLLFDRRGYRARLTPAGDELLREGRHLLAAADDLARRVQRVASGWEQALTLAVDNIVPFEPLLPVVADFLAVAPTQLRITSEVLGGTWDVLLSGRADLAIGGLQVVLARSPSCLRSRRIIRWLPYRHHCQRASCASIGRSSSATRHNAWLHVPPDCWGWRTH